MPSSLSFSNSLLPAFPLFKVRFFPRGTGKCFASICSLLDLWSQVVFSCESCGFPPRGLVWNWERGPISSVTHQKKALFCPAGGRRPVSLAEQSDQLSLEKREQGHAGISPPFWVLSPPTLWFSNVWVAPPWWRMSGLIHCGCKEKKVTSIWPSLIYHGVPWHPLFGFIYMTSRWGRCHRFGGGGLVFLRGEATDGQHGTSSISYSWSVAWEHERGLVINKH